MPMEKKALQCLQHQVVVRVFGLNQEHDPPLQHRDLQSLGLVVDVHQEEIVQKKALDKPILVHFIAIHGGQALQMAEAEAPRHHCFVVCPGHSQYVEMLCVFQQEQALLSCGLLLPLAVILLDQFLHICLPGPRFYVCHGQALCLFIPYGTVKA